MKCRLLLSTLLLLIGSATVLCQKNQPEKPTSASSKIQKPCIIRNVGSNDARVCVCNSTYCDTIPRPQKLGRSKYVLYTTNKAGLRFHKTTGRFVHDSREKLQGTLEVISGQKLQKVLGWGGAFTDSTGINILDLDEAAQDLLLKSYFSDEGIEYNLCRVPIAGTDFSTHAYTYDDTETDDPDLKKFTLAPEDLKYKIPFMKKALQLRNNSLQFFGSPWGAPRWMKTNNATDGYGFIKEKYYSAWAQYFVKFLEEYKKNGIDMWGVTTQNEALLAFLGVKNIPTVGWNSQPLGTWIREDLGPAVRSSFPGVKIMALDDQAVLLPWAINSILEDNNTKDFVDGIAVHWYFDSLTPCKAYKMTKKLHPGKFLLSTEACSGFQGSTGVYLGSWDRGESYSQNIIDDLNCEIEGWVDWNMVLNPQGGPTFIDNYVDSPIIVNKTSGEFYKQPMYYHIGHHSKFVPAGSVRINLKGRLAKGLNAVGYQRPDKGIAIVVLNTNDKERIVKITDKSVGEIPLKVSSSSINTLLYWY